MDALSCGIGGRGAFPEDENAARRLRQLEQENHRLKHRVADLTLDKQTLQELVRKKF